MHFRFRIPPFATIVPDQGPQRDIPVDAVEYIWNAAKLHHLDFWRHDGLRWCVACPTEDEEHTLRLTIPEAFRDFPPDRIP
jgi:hypothetical protein